MQQVSQHDRDIHIEVEMLLPWYVNNTLDIPERAIVDTHIAECPDCATLLLREFRLREALVSQASDTVSASKTHHVAFKRPPTSPSVWKHIRHRNAMSSTRAVRSYASAALQAAAFAGVFFIGYTLQGQNQMASPNADEAYRTLSASKPSSSVDIVVTAQQNASEADFRSALAQAGAMIVDGPTDTGAYIVRITPNEQDKKIKALRQNSAIALAEPIDGTIQ